MRRQIIFGILSILAIGGIVAAFIWGPDGDWDRERGDRVEIVRVADDGTGTTDAANVVVVDDQRPFFFPFGLLIVPLVFFLLFGLFRGAFFGGGGRRGGDPAWLEDWHRRQHQADRLPDDTTPDRQP